MAIDEAKMQELLGKMVSDMGAAAVAPLVVLGDKLGLYRALSERPMNTEELADQTGTTERYVREWCSAQAGFGYIEYQPEDQTFSLSDEQKAVFSDESSPTSTRPPKNRVARRPARSPGLLRQWVAADR